jgi:hypothetical protein
MLQTFKLNKEKWNKSSFYEEKSLVGLTPGTHFKTVLFCCCISTGTSESSFFLFSSLLHFNAMSSEPTDERFLHAR